MGKNFQLWTGLSLLGFILASMTMFVLLHGIDIGIDVNGSVGADDLGRDFFSCIVYGASISLFISVTVVFLSTSIGTLLGMVSGLSGGIIDTVIMRMADIAFAFPGILPAIAIVTFFKQSILTLILALSFSTWAGCARLVRGEVLKCKQKEFILAAASYNASFPHIIFHHLLPVVLPLVVVQASLDMPGIILAESSLNFLGIGLEAGIPTLGQLLDAGRVHIFHNPRFVLVPGFVLFFIIIAFNFIGVGLSRKMIKR
jgi:peptide/nickel transport system permease protein